jgi:hypothetical protein
MFDSLEVGDHAPPVTELRKLGYQVELTPVEPNADR